MMEETIYNARGGKGLLDPDQAEGLRAESFQAQVCAECVNNGYETSDHATQTVEDIERNIIHDIATLREMLNPMRVHDLTYLRKLKEWSTTLQEDIDRLHYARS